MFGKWMRSRRLVIEEEAMRAWRYEVRYIYLVKEGGSIELKTVVGVGQYEYVKSVLVTRDFAKKHFEFHTRPGGKFSVRTKTKRTAVIASVRVLPNARWRMVDRMEALCDGGCAL